METLLIIMLALLLALAWLCDLLLKDVRRLNWLENNWGRINHYVNAGGGEDSGKLFWHARMPSGFLSKDHGNTLRAAIDAARKASSVQGGTEAL